MNQVSALLELWLLAAEIAAVGANIDVNTQSGQFARGDFTRDTVFVGPDNIVYKPILIGNSRRTFEKYRIRQEQTNLLERMKDKGYDNIIDVNANFEGGAVTYDHIADQIIINQLTYQKEKDFEQAIKELENATGKTVIGLPFNDPDFFHLDTFLSILPNGEVLFYEGGTTEEGKNRLYNVIAQERIIPVSHEDALNYSTNIKAVGNNLFTASTSPQLRNILESKGYQVITPEDKGLSKGDWLIRQGGPHCMTQSSDQFIR